MFQESLFYSGLRQFCQESDFFPVWLGAVNFSSLQETVKSLCVCIYILLHISTPILTYINNIRIQQFSIKGVVIKAADLLFKKVNNEFASLIKGKKAVVALDTYVLY